MGGLAVAAITLCGQDTPSGVLRGTIVERGQGPVGEIAIRDDGYHVYRLRYDARTWAERDGRRIEIADMAYGDDVEIISDRASNPKHMYARRIRVMPPERPLARRPRWPRPRYRSPYDDMFPRGDMTFAGTVAEISPESLLLRAHGKGPTRILLREDTRYLAYGGEVSAADLAINDRVFIRAGKNIEGEVEAYSIVWGKIFNPHD